MRYAVIWSNGGRYEWIIYNDDETIYERSGLIFLNRDAAKVRLAKKLKELEAG